MIIKHHIPLADKNWFNTGGNASFYAEPTSAEQFQQALTYGNQHDLPIFLLGAGANILISDDGFDGLVIRPQLKEIYYKEKDESVLLTAGAGVTIAELIDFCLAHQLLNLEEFSGIPGTVGGSLYINLHYYEFLLEQFLHEALVIDKNSGELHQVQPSWFEFGYNKSRLQQQTHYVIEATFKVRKATAIQTAYAQGRSVEIIRHRQRRYPQARTCGSFFRNFFPEEVTMQSDGKKIIYVAYYLDKIGVKGILRIGDAQVSHQHANMIINLGNATSQQILELAKRMQELVYKDFGVVPRPECILVGFKQNPLLNY